MKPPCDPEVAIAPTSSKRISKLYFEDALKDGV